jgi:two-component system response regulator QseB
LTAGKIKRLIRISSKEVYMRLLLVEQNQILGTKLRNSLVSDGYTVDWLQEQEPLRDILDSEKFEAVLFDIDFHLFDTIQEIKSIRSQGIRVPLLILTEKNTVSDCVIGLEAGADDYLCKPIELEELHARLQAIIRRSVGRAHSQLVCGDILLDTTARQTTFQGKQIALNRKEYVLLRGLLENNGRVLTRERLKEMLYGWESDNDSNTLEVYIHHLRKKLYPSLIRTIRGVGYLIAKTS